MSSKPEPEDTETFALLYEAYEKYEQRKAMLSKDLSPEEYQAACRKIADELNI